jgi:lantibiotic modifying enzyme
LVKISDVEFAAIVKAAADWNDYFPDKSFPLGQKARAITDDYPLPNLPELPKWAAELRKMFDSFAGIKSNSRTLAPLQRLCEIGALYGMQRLKGNVAPPAWVQLTPRARLRLKRNLERILARVSRPCFALELAACRFAHEALNSQQNGPSLATIEQALIQNKPAKRLLLMFKQFPVLARLWSQLISEWCDKISETLGRLIEDKRFISRAFFAGRATGKIIDLRAGLSDPHNHGRTVMLLHFETGSIIYKPRPGNGEQEWFNFVEWLNAQAFQPKLKAAKILDREGYCWMELVDYRPCKDRAGACRFYQRLGGTIAIAYFLRAVDCHRDNVIASGEYPVLIDAEALWHVPPGKKVQTPLATLYQTGFLPRSDRSSLWQYRSSALAKARGKHVPRIGSRTLNVALYQDEVINGFRRAWRCIFSAARHHCALADQLRRPGALERRRIFWPTQKYDFIRHTSLQPAALVSGLTRELLIFRLCKRDCVSEEVICAEVNALKGLDIPYFRHKVEKQTAVREKKRALQEIVRGLRRSVRLCAKVPARFNFSS